MADVGQRDIGYPHGNEGIIAPQEDDYPEVIIGCAGTHDDNEGEDDQKDQEVTIPMVTQPRETPPI